MAKKIKAVIKIQIEAGKATPAPPVGTALGPQGINIGDFCKQFNDATKEMTGDIVPAVLTVFEDRTFSFILKTPPVSSLLKKAAGVDKGSGDVPRKKSGTVSISQVDEIAEKKVDDLNVKDKEAARRVIEGTAKSMGIEIKR
ncbi:MAG: 50S ribosomal protein L11 [Candidatus Pacebacteria bacterium]|nr:50S ribosomal protein L11 [Candidatus Paceibacterota bacterium]